MEASCTLPIITRFGFFSEFRGHKTVDGGFTASIPFKYEESEKIFLNVLPTLTRKWPFVWTQPKNL
jgi:predicted patatin/cPLA2 family phospholipase